LSRGEGKTAEIDGGYFAGYIKPANQKEYRRDAALLAIRTASARCVIIRERGAIRFPAVFGTESQSGCIHPRSHREGHQRFTPTKPRHGMGLLSVRNEAHQIIREAYKPRRRLHQLR